MKMFGWMRKCRRCAELERELTVWRTHYQELRAWCRELSDQAIATNQELRQARSELDTLRNEGTYAEPLFCSNCAHRWDGRVIKGFKVEEAGLECPNCGCVSVQRSRITVPSGGVNQQSSASDVSRLGDIVYPSWAQPFGTAGWINPWRNDI